MIAYAARLLPTIAPTLAPPTSVRRAPGELSFLPSDEPVAGAVAAAQNALQAEGSVGLIVPNTWVDEVRGQLAAAGLAFGVLGEEPADDEHTEFEARLDMVPANLAKGLEFDHVVLLEPAEIAAGEADEVTGLRRLYVCLTRAVTSLVVVHAQPIPAPLSDA